VLATPLQTARRQPTDIRVVQDGPPHAPSFKAMLSFQAQAIHHRGRDWFDMVAMEM